MAAYDWNIRSHLQHQVMAGTLDIGKPRNVATGIPDSGVQDILIDGRTATNLVFIDSRVADQETLVAGNALRIFWGLL